MQLEPTIVVSPSPRTTIQDHADLRTIQSAKPDTRRFAALFSFEPPTAVAADDRGAKYEDHDDTADPASQCRRVVPDGIAPTSQSQAASVASTVESSALSEAQQIAVCYRAVHGSGYAPARASTEINEKVSQIPDDQRSMYTITTLADTQSAMDMMWKPKPKVHMHRTDQCALILAQSQAVAMMHNAGLKPTNKIQCRRRGCADILPGVEALKYHLHIHNIADVVPTSNSVSPASELSLVKRNLSTSKSSKKSHCRSKSSFGTPQKSLAACFPSRKLSADSVFPPHLVPREVILEGRQDIPTLSTVSVVDRDQTKSPNFSAHKKSGSSFTHASTPSRGRRRGRKPSMTVDVGAVNPSIAMLLSPPASPDARGRLVFSPQTNTLFPFVLNPISDWKDNRCIPAPMENTSRPPEKLRESRSPIRALSPTRAMSPIRNGIRRVLSIGCSVESDE